jgi:hypothetical protein
MAEKDIRIGRRVWVYDATEPSGRSFGRIVTVLTDIRTGKRGSFVVQLEARSHVVACDEHRRGEQWDLAD